MQASAVMRFEGPKAAGILRLLAPLLVAFAIVVGGCTMNETEQRTVSGAGIGAVVGAAGGALFGAFAGVPGTGAAIGAAVGTAVGGAGGYIYDQHKKTEEAQAETQKLKQQNQQLQQKQQ